MSLITCQELMAITGYQRPADVARCLREQGIHVFNGKTGPWTTLDLINRAGGIEAGKTTDDAVNPEDIL